MKHLYLITIALVITVGTLFIPQKVNNINKPFVNLGYPIKFVSIDFTRDYPDIPSEKQMNRKFNILSSWEKHVETSWVNFTLSYSAIIITLEIFYVLINKFKFK